MILSKEKTPSYWEIVPLGDVCLKATKVKRKEVDIEKELRYLDIGSINNVTNRITEHKVYKWKDAPSRAQQIVQVGDILFSTVRVYLRNIAKIDNPLYENQICSSGFTVVRGNRGCCDPKYLFAVTLYEGFLQPLNELQTGTSYPAVRDSDVFSQLIPFPPLPEQRAIVSKIEQLFSELDNGISNLKLAQEQLKVYRQAVLKKAFEGELTKKWREQQTDLPDAGDLLKQIRKEREEAAKVSGKKLKQVNSLSEAELAELPKLSEGWGWVRLEEISTKITDGEHITPTRTESGYYLLSARNIQNGYLDLKNVDYVPKEEYFRIRNRCNPEEGDILISCSGSIGRICSVPKNSEFVMVRSAALVKLPSKLKLNRFFEYQLQSPLLQSQIEKGKKATAQANLFLGPISNLKVVLCSLPEQQAIVQEIETRLSVCDKIEQDIADNLEKAEALRQSILKKAFEGKLLNERELAKVRGAEDWEPAEVLLERIRAERTGK